MIEAAILEGIERARADRARSLDVLNRSGRAIDTWKRDMAKLLLPAGFRASASSREDVEAVLFDPCSTAEQRLGAALALSTVGDDVLKARVRIVAEASAHARMRSVLLRIASGRDAQAEIEQVL